MPPLTWLKRVVRSPKRRTTTPSARPATVRLRLESLEDRTTPYAVSGNLWAHPEMITVSFVPDGTLVNGVASNLQATFNTKFGAAATWQNVFKEAAQVWAQQTNINFNFVTDSGAATGSGSYQQGDTTFGDIRIGGYNFGNTTLAQAFMPPLVNNYSIAGDIAFNTNQTFNIGSAYNLFTVASHEFGHALGLNHGAVGSIMASAYPGTVTALTTDDINGIRNVYSANAARAKDSYDTAAANETFATASLVTSSINTTTKAGVINNLDLSTSTDVDWYKFVVPSGSATTLKVKAVATGLSLLDPKIEIYDSANVLKATGNGAAYGSTASAQFTVAAGQTWYVKVYSADAKAAFKTGKYSLVLNMGTGADPAVALPTTQTANGTPLTSGGGTAVTDGVETPVNGGSTFKSGALATMSFAEGGTLTPVSTGEPKIAIDGSGNYAVVWASTGQDGSGQGIYAQRYNASGVAQGSEFKVNTTTAGDQITPAVGIEGNGNLTIAWSSYGQDAAGSWGIYAQRYNASGVAQGSEFRANTTTAGDQINPVIAVNSNPTATSVPNFEIAWSSYNQDASNSWGIYAQRYTAAGVVAGLEFRVNTTTTGDQKISGAAVDIQGNFIVVWTSAGQDGNLGGIYAAQFDNLGINPNGEFRVNTTTTGDQTNAAVTTDKYGNFYVTWQSYNQDAANTWGIVGQQYSSTGAAIGSEFLVNSTTAGDQVNPATKMDSLGHLVIVWNGNGVSNTDGVFMQRYSVNTAQEVPPVGDAWDPNGDGDEIAAAAGVEPVDQPQPVPSVGQTVPAVGLIPGNVPPHEATAVFGSSPENAPPRETTTPATPARRDTQSFGSAMYFFEAQTLSFNRGAEGDSSSNGGADPRATRYPAPAAASADATFADRGFGDVIALHPGSWSNDRGAFGNAPDDRFTKLAFGIPLD